MPGVAAYFLFRAHVVDEERRIGNDKIVRVIPLLCKICEVIMDGKKPVGIW